MFQPTRPVKGATRLRAAKLAGSIVSTHAPREGRDVETRTPARSSRWFQPTRPVKGATRPVHNGDWSDEFQPTRPVKGATGQHPTGLGRQYRFNPRAP